MFINALIQDESWNVVGVKSKGGKFAYGPIKTAEELRLDYDTTILPPKKYFFPQRETLFSFDVSKGVFTETAVATKSTIIIGVHPYDIVALLHMDEVFRETKSDPYYSEKRQNSLIIGINIQKMSKWNFSTFMGCATVDYGYDLMLTDLGTKYTVETGSKKGEELLARYATNLRDAYANEVQMVGRKKMEMLNMSQQKLDFAPDSIPELLKHNYANSAFLGETL